MKKETLERLLASFPGAEETYPFGPEALVFKVLSKMFALVSQDEEPARVNLKCDPVDGANLVGQYESVTPGYHMNKKHWITVSLTGDLPDDLLADLARGSYERVVRGLSKADRQKLAGEESRPKK